MRGVLLVAERGRGSRKAAAIRVATERLAVPCACLEVGAGPADEFEALLAALDPGCVLLVELTAATAECGELATGRTTPVALVPIDLPDLPADCAPGARSREWRRFVTDVLAATPDAA